MKALNMNRIESFWYKVRMLGVINYWNKVRLVGLLECSNYLVKLFDVSSSTNYLMTFTEPIIKRILSRASTTGNRFTHRFGGTTTQLKIVLARAISYRNGFYMHFQQDKPLQIFRWKGWGIITYSPFGKLNFSEAKT